MKTAVAILGATGTVGQKFVELLAGHPWFEVREVVASDRSAGRRYGEVARWRGSGAIPDDVAALTIKSVSAGLDSPILFSGLDSEVAGEAESEYAARGHFVISNSKNHRMDDDVPLVIPEINCDHFALLRQQGSAGKIVTNANCSTIALALALAPLERSFGVEAVSVSTLQAVSGAGYPGVASLDILGNVIPYIGDEEEKIETEPRKILGALEKGEAAKRLTVRPAEFTVSAQCTRVPVAEGHTELVSVRLRQRGAAIAEVGRALREFSGDAQRMRLPFAPRHPIHVSVAPDRPQALRDAHAERGMAITVGRLRACPVNDVKFVVLEHNTIRGAAGAAILNVEACRELGYLP